MIRGGHSCGQWWLKWWLALTGVAYDHW